MKKIILAIALIALTTSCKHEPTNEYVIASIEACEQAVEAVNATQTEKAYRDALKDYHKAVRKVRGQFKKSKKALENAIEQGDESVAADVLAANEAELKLTLAKNRKKLEFKAQKQASEKK